MSHDLVDGLRCVNPSPWAAITSRVPERLMTTIGGRSHTGLLNHAPVREELDEQKEPGD